jgi:hypothetical protein
MPHLQWSQEGLPGIHHIEMLFCRESSAALADTSFEAVINGALECGSHLRRLRLLLKSRKRNGSENKSSGGFSGKRRRQQQIASQLSAFDRHQYYSKLLDQLLLSEPDRTNLERRGFTTAQIEADGYRSVGQWQKVSGQFPSNLPGLLSDGRLNSQPGYIFPVEDVDGLIVALSIG